MADFVDKGDCKLDVKLAQESKLLLTQPTLIVTFRIDAPPKVERNTVTQASNGLFENQQMSGMA
jgi:hypothetical protein